MDILRAAHKYKMLKSGDKVLVAVSGGPDSVVLLHALHALSDELEFSLHIAHLNHGIRGEQSNIDEVFVRNLAHSLGIDVTTRKVDIPTLRQEMHVGEEDAARTVRYSFLQETATNIGANKIAVGHNADDRAESVLLNLIRGAGVDGLGSIRPVRGNIIRPLIDTYRREIEAYIKETKIPFRVDESNTDINYSRNRIRHELIPLIEEYYNPQIKSALNRVANIATHQSDFLSTAAQTTVSQVTYHGNIDAGLLLDLPAALQSQIIRSEICKVKGDLKDLTSEQVGRVIEALQDGGNFTITLPSGKIYAIRDDDAFKIMRKEPPEETVQYKHKLEIPGITTINEARISLLSEIVTNPVPQKTQKNEVLINADIIAGPLHVRNLATGDKITPFGMRGEKKLQDVFVDKKIPQKLRAKTVIIADDEKILWVSGIVSSEATRITEKTRHAIHITSETI